INGVDVYDPTTGAVRSNSTDDIACWFIDTDYDEESFFVRHAYFTGAQEPYDRLKRALRAEIDEDAWATLYRTESRPFPAPLSGKVAVKVINHNGDEVMKVDPIDPSRTPGRTDPGPPPRCTFSRNPARLPTAASPSPDSVTPATVPASPPGSSSRSPASRPLGQGACAPPG
ncbi:MAG: hypothetical protein M3462_08400, partial [Chloroflexota bacterium]|nr:hypothetical protein [Chloroflexota bacterium]